MAGRRGRIWRDTSLRLHTFVALVSILGPLPSGLANPGTRNPCQGAGRRPAAGEAPLNDSSTAALAQTLIGTWQSDGDSRFTRSFDVDGTVTDRYEGDESATTKGKWRLFTGKNRDPLLDSVVKGLTYLRIDNSGDVTFYVVVKADRLHLHLRYADRRGFSLKFTRTKDR